MTQPDMIEKIARRTQRYWYQDGIWEIGFGLVNTILGVLNWLNASFKPGTLPAIVLVLMQMGVIFASYFITSRVVGFLKTRITYPRTGYVVYRKPGPKARMKRILQTILIAGGIGALVGITAAIQLASNRLPLVISVIMAGTLVYVGHRFELIRMYVIAGLAVVLGYLISLYPLNDQASVGAFFSGFGLLMLLSGGISLLIYLRHTKPPSSLDSDGSFTGTSNE